MQIERKRAAETETCVPMEEDTKTANSTEQDDEVKQLLAKVSEHHTPHEPTYHIPGAEHDNTHEHTTGHRVLTHEHTTHNTHM